MTDNTKTLWQELTVSALLGTQRRTFSVPESTGAVGNAIQIAGIDPQDSEHALLRAAAVASLHRRAGRLPARFQGLLPQPCPEEDLSRCTKQSANCLKTILDNEYLELLPEWTESAARLRQSIPEEILPELFQKQKALQNLRLLLLPVLGERGHWLARQNPDWGGFTTSSDDSTWHEGKRQERLTYLSDLRAQDPQRARDLVQTSWGQEAPTEKAAILKILAQGLSMEDEPFLEIVLDDRRKEVRQAATHLLACLPQSCLVQRMTGRACRLLTWKSGLLRSSLEVKLPAVCDEDMQRDGVDIKPPPDAKLGEKAWWLSQILSCVPPSTWCELWNKRPQQLLDSVRKHEWEEALALGWREAACNHHDREWLEALLDYETDRKDTAACGVIFSHLPVEAKEDFMIGLLSGYPSLSYEESASIYLSACRHPWSSELTQAAVNVICSHVRKGDIETWLWDRLLSGIAPYMNAGMLAQITTQIKDDIKKRQGPFDPAVKRLVTLLGFRQDMLASFNLES